MSLKTSPISVQIDRLKNKWRWCAVCGTASVHPATEPGVIKCQDCRDSTEPGKHCIRCGDEIDRGRLAWFTKNRPTPCRQCLACARFGKKPHILWNVLVPDHWHYLDLPPHQIRPAQ